MEIHIDDCEYVYLCDIQDKPNFLKIGYTVYHPQ